MAHTILLVEDDASTREHLARMLSGDPRLQVVAAAETVAEGRAALTEHRPDVLITDLELPDGHGTELIRAIEEHGLDTLAMVITVFADRETVVAALEAGALGYLLKDGPPEALVRSTIELLDGGSPISPRIARRLLQRFQTQHVQTDPAPSRRRAIPAEELPKLSEREQQVLRYLVKGFTYAEAAELLGITPHTVATHVRKVYRKLSVRSRGEAVYEAFQLGLVDDS